MVMNLSGQPVIQLAEMQPASQFQLPALPALIGIQQAYADTSFTFNDNLVNDCEQFGAGVDNENCTISVVSQIDPGTQDPPTGTSNLYDVSRPLDGHSSRSSCRWSALRPGARVMAALTRLEYSGWHV